jgi:hypothetical protein
VACGISGENAWDEATYSRWFIDSVFGRNLAELPVFSTVKNTDPSGETVRLLEGS